VYLRTNRQDESAAAAASRATIPGMPKRKAWFWALRRERARSGELPDGWHYGGELGFTGEAAQVAVSTGYEIRPVLSWEAPPVVNHMDATYSYLRMIAKRAYLWASERGDQKATAMLDATYQNLADRILLALDATRREMGTRGCEEEELETCRAPGGEREYRRPPDDDEFECRDPDPPRMRLVPPGSAGDWRFSLPEIQLDPRTPGDGDGS